MLPRRRFLALAAAAPFAIRVGSDKAHAGPASLQKTEAAFAFRQGEDFTAWQARLRERLASTLGLPELTTPSRAALDPQVKRDGETADYTVDRVRFTAEPGEDVPGYLLRPKGRASDAPLPVMICLQGHTPGMHLSIGLAKTDAERKLLSGGRDIALQAVARGWAALAIEQRGFGERASRGVKCNDLALYELHRGRPLTGQRVLDVMRAIDFIGTQPGLDARRVACMGNSTGGTVSFYAACVEPRLGLSVVSCSFSTFADSWLSIPHCACGYLPGIAGIADMPDLAGLIAPRRLLIVAGKKDHLARFSGVETGYARARELFAAAGSPSHVRLVAGEGGHEFFPDLAWPVIDELTGMDSSGPGA